MGVWGEVCRAACVEVGGMVLKIRTRSYGGGTVSVVGGLLVGLQRCIFISKWYTLGL